VGGGWNKKVRKKKWQRDREVGDCVPVEEGREYGDERVTEEQERCSRKSDRQGEKFGEEKERGAREVM
jgi:hypothetical protein